MSTLIYYLRHAQSKPDPSVDTSNWPLSELGYQQAEKLADVLSISKFAKIYSSPYRRCLETIAPYCKKHSLTYQSVDELKERKLVASYNRKNYQEVHRKSWIYFSFALPGCESSKDAQKRIMTSLKDIAREHPGEKVLISGHGQLLALLLKHINPNFGFSDQRRLFNPDMKVFKVSADQITESQAPCALQSAVKEIAVPAVKF